MVFKELLQPHDAAGVLLPQGSKEGDLRPIHLCESLAVAPNLDLIGEVRLCTRFIIDDNDSGWLEHDLIYTPIESGPSDRNVS